MLLGSQPWEDTKLMLRCLVTLTYQWDPKVVIYFLWIGSLLIKEDDNRYTQYRNHDIVCVWDSILLGDPKDMWLGNSW